MTGGCGVRVAAMWGRAGSALGATAPRLGEHEREDDGGGRHGPRTLYNRGDGNRGSPGRTARRADLVRHPQSRRRRAAAGAAAGAELRALGAASVDEVDVGDHAYVYARFGGERAARCCSTPTSTPCPPTSGYTSPPHLLVRRGDRLYGLGTADIKGAIAAILEALAAGPITRPVGVLFSGDEEHGGSCIRAFLDTRRGARAGAGDRLRADAVPGRRAPPRHRRRDRRRWRRRADIRRASTSMVNPIAVLARAAVALDDMGIELRVEGAARASRAST